MIVLLVLVSVMFAFGYLTVAVAVYERYKPSREEPVRVHMEHHAPVFDAVTWCLRHKKKDPKCEECAEGEMSLCSACRRLKAQSQRRGNWAIACAALWPFVLTVLPPLCLGRVLGSRPETTTLPGPEAQLALIQELEQKILES